MKAGEQLSAMEMMAIDPVQRILAPRFWGGVLVMPDFGQPVFSAVGILGGWVVGVLMIGVDSGSFWGQMQERRRCVARRGQWRHQKPGVWYHGELCGFAPRV
jgi:ABC-type transporter Mla maintaining outer membrane lipid asymmetry permease subunit MlaE